MRTVIFKSCFKDDMQSFMEYRVATFAWNTYRLDNYRLSSFDRYLTKISYNDEIVPQAIINQWLNDVGVPEASINGYIKTIRNFMKYRADMGKVVYLPPFQKTKDLYIPYIFSDEELSNIEQCSVPPKSKTGEGLQFIINQEKYLRVFLEDGDVPIDNSASERAIRTFCLGKKNWMFHNTANGAAASALVYSISETAKLNNLRPYYYFKYILTELPNFCDEQGNIDSTKLDDLMPWSDKLPEECRKPHR